jgi:hypothetical protein
MGHLGAVINGRFLGGLLAFMEEDSRIVSLRYEIHQLQMDEKRLQSVLSSESYRESVKQGVREELRKIVDCLAALVYVLNSLEAERRT